jgi:hypothetical protein
MLLEAMWNFVKILLADATDEAFGLKTKSYIINSNVSLTDMQQVRSCIAQFVLNKIAINSSLLSYREKLRSVDQTPYLSTHSPLQCAQCAILPRIN